MDSFVNFIIECFFIGMLILVILVSVVDQFLIPMVGVGIILITVAVVLIWKGVL